MISRVPIGYNGSKGVGEMRSILVILGVIFLSYGIVYSQDWGKSWDLVPNEHEFGSMTIETGMNNQYKVQLHYMENDTERYPLECGHTLQPYDGKMVGNELVLSRNGKERFRIVKNGDFLKVIPNLSGKNDFYCGDEKYEKSVQGKEFEDIRKVLKNSFNNIKWKKSN